MEICGKRRAPALAFVRALVLSAAAVVSLAAHSAPAENDFPAAIARIKPSIVAIGTFEATRVPAFQFAGTGFAVGDGSLVATNSHVVPATLDAAQREAYAIAIPQGGGDVQLRQAAVVARDADHDVVLLRIDGPRLPAAPLGDSNAVREGELFGLIGFPVGAILGLYPTTHRAMISTITPVVLPQASARRLDPLVVDRLRTGGFDVFQLDATAYPGSSGSPLFSPESGEVIAIVNMVFVKGTKEAALASPTGITYAIPIRYLRELLERSPARQ